MIDNLKAQFANRDGERAFVTQAHDMVRAQNFEAVEAWLSPLIAAIDHPLAHAALKTSHKTISLSGWSGTNLQLIRPLWNTKCLPDAIGLDLSNYAEIKSAPGELDPSVETAYYTNGVFDYQRIDFSFNTREELIALAAASYQPPWAGGFDEIDSLNITGLGRVNYLIQEMSHDTKRRRSSNQEVDIESVILVLAQLWVGLQYHQMISRLIAEGCAREVPIMVGGHGEPYVAESVYIPTKIVDFTEPELKDKPDIKKVVHILAEQAIKRTQGSDKASDIRIRTIASLILGRPV